LPCFTHNIFAFVKVPKTVLQLNMGSCLSILNSCSTQGSTNSIANNWAW